MVFLLETASHIVKLLTGSVAEGITNGNIENPAVKITPAIDKLLPIKAKPSFLNFAFRRANIIPKNPINGAAIIQG